MEFVIKCACDFSDDCMYIERITEAIEYWEDEYPSISDFDDIIIVSSDKFLWNGNISDSDYSCMISCGVLKNTSDDHLRWIIKRLYFDTELNNLDEIDDDGDDEYSNDEDAEDDEYSDDEETEDMSNLEMALMRLNRIKPIDYDVEIINSDRINAFATHDGKIQITSAAANSLPEEELAFMIAHEESHLDKEHRKKEVEMINSVGKTAGDIMKIENTGLFKRVLGVATVAVAAIGMAPLVLKGHEIQADVNAKERMLDAGYSEEDVLRFFKEHETSSGGYFSTHPTSHTRIKMLK